MGNCSAAIGPTQGFERQLYETPETAKAALSDELKKMREAHPGDAEEINGVLDELDAAGSDFVTYFDIDGQTWTVFYHDLGD